MRSTSTTPANGGVPTPTISLIPTPSSSARSAADGANRTRSGWLGGLAEVES